MLIPVTVVLAIFDSGWYSSKKIIFKVSARRQYRNCVLALYYQQANCRRVGKIWTEKLGIGTMGSEQKHMGKGKL